MIEVPPITESTKEITPEPIIAAPTPEPSQPAAPQVVVKAENSVWAFFADHWGIAVVATFALGLFFALASIHKFAEMGYGLLRVALVVITIVLMVYVWFRQTVREYLVSGAFVAEFRALEPHHRVAATLSVLVLVSWIVVQCFVHP